MCHGRNCQPVAFVCLHFGYRSKNCLRRMCPVRVRGEEGCHCLCMGTKAQLAWLNGLLFPCPQTPFCFFLSPCSLHPFLCHGLNIARGERGDCRFGELANQSSLIMTECPLQAVLCWVTTNSQALSPLIGVGGENLCSIEELAGLRCPGLTKMA